MSNRRWTGGNVAVLVAAAVVLASCKDFQAKPKREAVDKTGDAATNGTGADSSVGDHLGSGGATGARDAGGSVDASSIPSGSGGGSVANDPSGDASCGSPSDSKNCGTCGHDCTGLVNVAPGAAGVECRAGTCYVPTTACAQGFSHCTVRADDGCETNLLDSQNCGACGAICPAATPLCSAKGATAVCTFDCTAPTSDMCASSCVDLKSDPKNCGTCGHDCTSLPNIKAGAAGVACQAGVCIVPTAACAARFAHCSARPDDGCESSLTDSKTCGNCTTACPAATPVCSSTSGSPECTANCTGATADMCGTSCVNLKTDAKNCGTCGHDCSGLPNVKPGATVTCQAGICSVPPSACATGFAHCSTNPEDGCEADLGRPGSCGQCGKTCVAPTALCTTTTNPPSCASSCTTPTPTLCGTKCVEIQSDPSNCGLCGHNCTTLPNVKAGATGVECRSGACFVPPSACVSGFAHCPGAKPDDGCETSLTNTTNCGQCGKACVAPTGLCSTTTGAPTCASNCVAPAPTLCGAKCADTQSDPLNCGACNNNCAALPHVKAGAAVSCVAGVCQIPPSSCAAGFGHCAGSGNLGCEATLNACGGCGMLVGAPGGTCGACGQYACSAAKTTVTCSDPGLNACGGCGTLTGTVGASCGTCGKFACAASKTALACSDPGANACGGCGVITGTLNAACGKCGTNVCGANKTSVTCSDPGANACGGCGAVTGPAGASLGGTCGGCGHYACTTTSALACVGTPGPVSCLNNAPQTCTAAGQLATGAACSGATPTCSAGVCTCTPLPRDCSSTKDNDCNGIADNLDSTCVCAAGTTGPCPGNNTAPCKSGTRSCILAANKSSTSWGLTCVGQILPALSDSCDVAGNDANCNGKPNDTCACINGSSCGDASCSGNSVVGKGTCKAGMCAVPTPVPCPGGATCTGAGICGCPTGLKQCTQGGACVQCCTSADCGGTSTCTSANVCGCSPGLLSCVGAAASCQRRTWDFEDGTTGGFGILRTDFSMATRGASNSTAQHHGGTHSLAIPVTATGQARSFELDQLLCGSVGQISLTGLTSISAWFFVDGPPLDPASNFGETVYTDKLSPGQNFLFSSVIGQWFQVSTPVSGLNMSTSMYELGVGAVVNGTADWTGTVYVDDIAIQ